MSERQNQSCEEMFVAELNKQRDLRTGEIGF